jgi:hypothetical protein
MKGKLLFVAITMLLLLTPTLLRADITLVGADSCTGAPIDCSYGYYVNPPNESAVQFSLSTASYVSTIDVTLGDSGTDSTGVLSLVSNLTGPATTYGSFALGPLPYSYNSNEETVVLDQNLAAGTYYLVLAGLNSEGDINWGVSDGTYIQNGGTITSGEWSSGDSGTTWQFYGVDNPVCSVGCYAPMFDVNGTPDLTPTPEPASGVLMLLGAAVLGFVFLRRIRLCHPVT